MSEKRFTNEIGVEIILSDKLPQTLINEETGKLEIYHMVQNKNAIYVSQKLWNALKKRNGDVE